MVILRRALRNIGAADVLCDFIMDDPQKPSDLELLARMAARLAGRDPDRRVMVKLGDLIAFDDVAWRYPDFMRCAEAAYLALNSPPPAAIREIIEACPVSPVAPSDCAIQSGTR
jgi:hypothetical protein